MAKKRLRKLTPLRRNLTKKRSRGNVRNDRTDRRSARKPRHHVRHHQRGKFATQVATKDSRRRHRRKATAQDKARQTKEEQRRIRKRIARKRKRTIKKPPVVRFRDYLVMFEFSARPTGGSFKKYSRSMIVTAPDGASRSFVTQRVADTLPRALSKLVSDRDLSKATIAKGPIVNRPKRIRQRQ